MEGLAAFLRIDSDLLHVAAEASAPQEDTTLKGEEVRVWVAGLSTKNKDDVLTRLILERDQALVVELFQRFLKERAGRAVAEPVARRRVGELLRAAEAYTEERQRIEAERRAEEKARGEREAAIAREKHLEEIAGREPRLWAEVDTLIATKQPQSYDRAVRLLVDLRDLDARTKAYGFRPRLEALRQAHARKPTFIQRLTKAGL